MTVAQVIELYQGAPFIWGISDCCRFASDCVRAVTGDDPMRKVRYDDHAGADALVDELGGLEACVRMVMGDPVERAPQENDVVLVTYRGQQIVGFVWSERVLIRTQGGLVDWPLETVEMVFCLKPPPQ